jgi:hypothetical protein
MSSAICFRALFSAQVMFDHILSPLINREALMVEAKYRVQASGGGVSLYTLLDHMVHQTHKMIP